MTKDTEKWSSSACTNVCETVIGMLKEAGFKEDHSNLLEMLNQVKFVPIGSVAVTGMHTGSEEERRQSRPDDTT